MGKNNSRNGLHLLPALNTSPHLILSRKEKKKEHLRPNLSCQSCKQQRPSRVFSAVSEGFAKKDGFLSWMGKLRHTGNSLPAVNGKAKGAAHVSLPCTSMHVSSTPLPPKAHECPFQLQLGGGRKQSSFKQNKSICQIFSWIEKMGTSDLSLQ